MMGRNEIVMWKFGRILSWVIHKAIFRLRVTGQENIPLTGGVILASNHISNFDAPTIAIIAPRPLNFLAKQEFFERKLIGKLLLALNCIPIDRAKPSMASLKRVSNLLKEGQAVAIFIQGRIQKDGSSKDYKSGAVFFAIKGEVPIVPINITSRFRLFSKVHVNIGVPISFEEYHGKRMRTEELNIIAQKLMNQIIALGSLSQGVGS